MLIPCFTFVIDSSQLHHTPMCTPTPIKKFKKKVIDTPKETKLKKQIKLLQQTIRRQNTKINTLEVCINRLAKEKYYQT